jgi:hypothetical protein
MFRGLIMQVCSRKISESYPQEIAPLIISQLLTLGHGCLAVNCLGSVWSSRNNGDWNT